mgnify:FL=1
MRSENEFRPDEIVQRRTFLYASLFCVGFTLSLFKALGVVDWSWVVVTIPFWIVPALVVFALVTLLIFSVCSILFAFGIDLVIAVAKGAKRSERAGGGDE